MRKKVMVCGILVLLLVLITACVAPPPAAPTDSAAAADEATVDSCAKLGDFGTRLAEFGQELTQFDSPEEAIADEGVNQAMANMNQAMEEFKTSAPEDMDDEALEQAADELERAFRDATEGMSRKEMAAAVTETFDLFNSECNIVNFGRPG